MAIGVAVRSRAKSATVLRSLLLRVLVVLTAAPDELNLGGGALAAEAAMTDAQVHGAHVEVDAIDGREGIRVLVLVAHQLHLMTLVSIVVCVNVKRG